MHRDRGRTGRLRHDEQHLELPAQLLGREPPAGIREIERTRHPLEKGALLSPLGARSNRNTLQFACLLRSRTGVALPILSAAARLCGWTDGNQSLRSPRRLHFLRGPAGPPASGPRRPSAPRSRRAWLGCRPVDGIVAERCWPGCGQARVWQRRSRPEPPAGRQLAAPVLHEPVIDAHPRRIGRRGAGLESSPALTTGDLEGSGLMTFDEATTRLLELARGEQGIITAQTSSKNDSELADEKLIVSAAAHALAGSTNVFATSGGSGWFPVPGAAFHRAALRTGMRSSCWPGTAGRCSTSTAS